MRGSFIFYRSFMDGLAGLPDDVYRRLVDAIMYYAMDGIEPDLTGLELAIFKAWKANVDASNKRKESGKLGGRPTKEKPLVIDAETIGYEVDNHWLEDEKPNKKEKEKENVKEKEKEKEKEKKGIGRFTPPTTQQVAEYVQTQGYNVDAQRFVDFYESKGWYVGKNKMKDWKAAVRGWSRSQRQELTANGRQEKTAKAQNFTPREYDYDDLERQLLAKQGAG